MTISHGEGCGCKDAEEILRGSEFLQKYINIEKITALNEKVLGSCKKVIKSYEDRFSSDYCESSVDHELILNIPFTSPCKIVSMLFIGGENGTYPKKIQIFANQEDIDFDNIEDIKCIQTIEVTENYHGSIEYPLKVTALNNVNYLTLYISENYGAQTSQLYYIGLKGIGSNYKRKAVETIYEASPNIADHKVEGGKDTLNFSFDAF